MRQICIYREAGVTLEQIKNLLDSFGENEENLLIERLEAVNKEIYLLRLQQKIIVEMLKAKDMYDREFMIDEYALISLLKSSG